MVLGMWRLRATRQETRIGLSLVQHSYWQKGQYILHQEMKEAMAVRLYLFFCCLTHSFICFSVFCFQTNFQSGIPKQELAIWEDQWLSCARRLNQWEVLAEYGQITENPEILVDTLWRIPDWTTLGESVLPRLDQEETVEKILAHAYVALHEGTLLGIQEAESKIEKVSFIGGY